MRWLRKEFRPGSATSSIRSTSLRYLPNQPLTAPPDTPSVTLARNGLNVAYAPTPKRLSIR